MNFVKRFFFILDNPITTEKICVYILKYNVFAQRIHLVLRFLDSSFREKRYLCRSIKKQKN